MAMNHVLFTASSVSYKQLIRTFSSSSIDRLSYSPSSSPFLHCPTLPSRKPRISRKSIVTAQSKGSNSADAPDRLISAITYFYPFFDGIQYGKYVITQFSPLQSVLQPLFPAIKAIVLDVLLIFPDLLERTFNPRDGVGLELMMSLDSTVFLFILASLIYGSSSCLFGQIPRLPLVADAADRQVL
ncbi:TIC 20-v, chloroplastic [Olea europaea subsp. europaea]|uniref:Protein TIC 20 n=1 Tax=Olea europaea subsp. europaea TaxID=158383 RepID=A0A8S0UHY9_OLEEU|nr:TIC 20-v, chloroplastic [Olea europaea subsp. europaea]